MARTARRGTFALRLEVLESRTLLSGGLQGGVMPTPRVTAAAMAMRHAPGITPSDPAFGQQWALSGRKSVNIDASRAWETTTGSRSIVVAVLDTGIDLSNPEFAGRLWTNPDSSGSDGHPGDVHGWNFIANDANVQDDNGHGTHVSGIIAANGDNAIGVAGVDWNAQIMPLKVLDAQGGGSDAAMAAAIDFAVQHGARVINASWGGGNYSQAVSDAISAAGSHGVVFVTAAGNDGTNDDAQPFYPASYRLPNEIAVAAVDSSGHLAAFSDFGAQTVALGAPGVNILSTIPGGYASESGTSMAAPYVTGVVSLVAGLHPSYTAQQLVNQVLTTTTPLPGLAGKTATGGIVDAARAVGQSQTGSDKLVGPHANRQSFHPSPGVSTVPHISNGTRRRHVVIRSSAHHHPAPQSLSPTIRIRPNVLARSPLGGSHLAATA